MNEFIICFLFSLSVFIRLSLSFPISHALTTGYNFDHSTNLRVVNGCNLRLHWPIFILAEVCLIGFRDRVLTTARHRLTEETLMILDFVQPDTRLYDNNS